MCSKTLPTADSMPKSRPNWKVAWRPDCLGKGRLIKTMHTNIGRTIYGKCENWMWFLGTVEWKSRFILLYSVRTMQKATINIIWTIDRIRKCVNFAPRYLVRATIYFFIFRKCIRRRGRSAKSSSVKCALPGLQGNISSFLSIINNKQSAQNDTEFQITFDVFSLLSFALYNQNLSRHTLKTHMLNHTSEPKKCPYCEKISPTRNALTIHIRGNDDLSIMILFSTNPECFDLRCSHGTLAQVSLMWKSI